MEKQLVYRIKVEGSLQKSWSEWLNGMIITHEIEDDGSTVTTLIGSVVDQTALHGLLSKIRDLGLQLKSVEQVEYKGRSVT